MNHTEHEPHGIVFEISRFRTDDGPGLRTAVFLKGCPLACIWCHNPESNALRPELLFDAGRCTGCGACARACPNACHAVSEGGHRLDRSRCTACGGCVRACPNAALRIAGRKMSVEEVMKPVLRDQSFYCVSGGGLTLTGGEPLLQAEFSLALLRAAHSSGIQTCIETCGYAAPEVMRALAEQSDWILYDCKAVNAEKHLALTGRGNEQILENLALLDRMNRQIALRVPVIPGCNDELQDLIAVRELARRYPSIRYVQIMPYHPLGLGKAKQLGRTPGYARIELPAREETAHWCDVLRDGLSIPVMCSTNLT